MYCDGHDCASCPGSKPGGPCWVPDESECREVESEMEYWDVRCSEEETNRDAEEWQLLDAIDADLAICAEIAAEEAYEAGKFNP